PCEVSRGSLGYVEVVLAEQRIRRVGAANDQRVPGTAAKLSCWDEEHERRARLRNRRIARENSRTAGSKKFITHPAIRGRWQHVGGEGGVVLRGWNWDNRYGAASRTTQHDGRERLRCNGILQRWNSDERLIAHRQRESGCGRPGHSDHRPTPERNDLGPA